MLVSIDLCSYLCVFPVFFRIPNLICFYLIKLYPYIGLIHFFLNMFALWFVGKAIEQIHGFFPAVVQFVVSAVGGTILSAIFLPEYITVGASGGIFGLIGGCIAGELCVPESIISYITCS